MKSKKTRFLKSSYVLCMIFAAVCLCSCGKKETPAGRDVISAGSNVTSSGSDVSSAVNDISPVSIDTPVSFHTEAQATYLADNYRNFKLYANGTEEMSEPVPILIGANGVVAGYAPAPTPEEPDVDSEDEDDEDEEPAREPVVVNDFSSAFVSDDEKAKYVIPEDYEVLVSMNSDMSDAKVISGSNNCAEIYNLLLGTKYYCQINTDKKTCEILTFTTEGKAPRNLYVEGVTNARDLGGWSTEDGGKVKQGLIFRTSKFNKDESEELMITAAGIDTMVGEFGVKTEIDLRTVDDNENGGITVSPLGSDVKYVSIPFQSGGNILLLNKDSFAELFAVLGDKSNYPIVFHCSIGTDRTGAVAFLVNGLLGVARDDLYRDFLFSNFGEIGSMRTPSIIKTYYDTVDMSAGSMLSEKIYNYLVGCGVEAADLDNLKQIMKED